MNFARMIRASAAFAVLLMSSTCVADIIHAGVNGGILGLLGKTSVQYDFDLSQHAMGQSSLTNSMSGSNLGGLAYVTLGYKSDNHGLGFAIDGLWISDSIGSATDIANVGGSVDFSYSNALKRNSVGLIANIDWVSCDNYHNLRLTGSIGAGFLYAYNAHGAVDGRVANAVVTADFTKRDTGLLPAFKTSAGVGYDLSDSIMLNFKMSLIGVRGGDFSFGNSSVTATRTTDDKNTSTTTLEGAIDVHTGCRLLAAYDVGVTFSF